MIRQPKIGPHYRAPWRPTDPRFVQVHKHLGIVKGTFGRSPSEARPFVQRYEKAKHGYSMQDAFEIVEEAADGTILSRLVDVVIANSRPAIVAFPNPGFHGGEVNTSSRQPTNALPFAFAAAVAGKLGCEIDSRLFQTARPGRTELTRFERFLWQPRFEGSVSPDHSYILADDVCTNGGTLAMLRSHIVENGGTVVAATTLAHKDGCAQLFPIEPNAHNVLISCYGYDLDALWRQEIGHDTHCLTQGECRGLLSFAEGCHHRQPVLQQLRDRLREAADGNGDR